MRIRFYIAAPLFVAGVLCAAGAKAPKFEVDPAWPKPLPNDWVLGQVSGVCIDAQDHVFIVNRRDITDKEAEIAKQAPPFLEFDVAGNLVNSFGEWEVVPNITHGCFIDHENNPRPRVTATGSSRSTATTESYFCKLANAAWWIPPMEH